MATLEITTDEVIVRLRPVERVLALSGDVHLPRSAIAGVDVVDRPMRGIRGLRMPGLGVPGVIALGTWRGGGRRFVAVRAAHGPGVRLRLDGHRLDEVLITVPDPRSVAAALDPGRAGPRGAGPGGAGLRP